MRLEQTILRNLIQSDDYMRKVLPFLIEDYFSDKTEKAIFKEIIEFSTVYNSVPSTEAIGLALNERKNFTSEELGFCDEYLKEVDQAIKDTTSTDPKWLLDKTEQFCQEKAVYNAVLSSIQILDGKDKVNDKGSIPKILSDALAISFDNSVGHD